jgi:hypothetical protein
MESWNVMVVEWARVNGWRTARLEDGEVVVRLVGGARGGYPSGHPHAGFWGVDKCGVVKWYVFTPCTQPSGRVRVARGKYPGLKDRSSDSEVLLVGGEAEVRGLLRNGPAWARARRKAVLTEAQKAERTLRLEEHRFKPAG